jgi:DNA (cytosine-5)-methyltransferase 1
LIRYLSLFSGIGGFEVGLHRVFADARCVGFSEIDSHASAIYRRQFPDAPALGSITDLDPEALPDFDLLIGGFPCQDLSIGNREGRGLDGARSGLFWTLARIEAAKQPRWFCFENVASMKTKDRDVISETLGVEPVLLDAADFSAQKRTRLFWCNWPVPLTAPLKQSADSGTDGMKLADVLLPLYKVRSLALSEREIAYMDRATRDGRTHWDFQHHHDTACDKSHCLPANLHKGVPYNVILDRRADPPLPRKLHPIEAERLQGFPDDWTAWSDHDKPISATQRYHKVGNAVQTRVAEHLFRALARQKEVI